MTQHDKAPELVERLKVVARCGTDSTMRHSAYASMAQDPDGDYVTYSAYAALAERCRVLEEEVQAERSLSDRLAGALEYIDDYALSYPDLGTLSAVAQPAIQDHADARAALAQKGGE